MHKLNRSPTPPRPRGTLRGGRIATAGFFRLIAVAVILAGAVPVCTPRAAAQANGTQRTAVVVASADISTTAPDPVEMPSAGDREKTPGGGMLEFTLTGFVFAIVNFLILMALLYRFLHKPLLDVLDRRRTAIETAQGNAREQAKQATAARQTYETRLAAIEEERDRMLTEAKKKASTERDELLAKARKQAEREVASVKREWERQRRDALEEVQDQVLDTTLAMVNRLLHDLADADCDAKLLQRLIDELKTMAAAPDTGRPDLFANETPVRVVSAGNLSAKDRKSLSDALNKLAGQRVTIDFSEDPALIAGARVEFVAAAIDANVAAVLADIRTEADNGPPATAPVAAAVDDGEHPAATTEPEDRT